MKKYTIILGLTICGLQAMYPGRGYDGARTPSPVLTQSAQVVDFSAGNGGFWGEFAPEYLKQLAIKNAHDKAKKPSHRNCACIAILNKKKESD